MKREWKLMAGLVILGAAMTVRAVDTYPTEAWPADADVQNYNGTSETATGLDYIPRGTSATSTPPLQIRQHRRDKRVNDILAETNELRVVKESTALRIGVFPGDYVVNGTRTHFDGATNQGSGTLTLGDDTYYVYVDNANALQIVTDAADWPADVTQFVPLAEVTVAGGAVTAIVDRRGWARTIIPQTGGAAASGVDGTFFVLDQDNGGAGAATTQYRFNRGSTAADAGIGWNETDDLVDVLLDVTAPSAGVLRAERFISTVATGTMPLQVSSTTLCLNLNADTVDGVGFSAAPAAANGVCYATSTSAAAFTAAPTAADVLFANGSGVPTWGALGATSGVQAYDADLTAVAALASTGLAARTAANTWAQRTITAGGSISVTNGDGVAGNPTIAVAGATQYAVQVGSSAGALASIAVGATNTVLAGNTGANPVFRQIVNADISDSADISGAKIADSSLYPYKIKSAGVVGAFLRINSKADGDPVSSGSVFELQNQSLSSNPFDIELHTGMQITNNGASALVTLTVAAWSNGVASELRLLVTDADGFRLVVPSGSTIRDGASVSSSGGYIESTTIGSTVTITIVSVTELWVVSKTGTWTLG